jgi:hypothetical protein
MEARLTREEYAEVCMHGVDPSKFAVCCYVWENQRTVSVYYADGKITRVPFSWFTAGNVVPDFTDPQLIDYGQTLRFGEHETDTEFLRSDNLTV